MESNENFSVRIIENSGVLTKSFLLFLDNFARSVREVSKDILEGKTKKIAALFSPESKDTFETVDVYFDELKTVEVISNLKELERDSEKDRQIVFDSFEFHLESLIEVYPKSDQIQIVKKLPINHNLLLGKGTLYVKYKTVPKKTIKNSKEELAA